MSFQTVNPATAEILQAYEHLSFSDAEKAADAAWTDYQVWRKSPLTERAQALRNWAHNLKLRREDLARQMSLEMGKPIAQGRAEIDKCLMTCEHLAENGIAFLQPVRVESPYAESWITYEAVGPVLAIMPWNFPLWQVVRFAAPAILVGNPILLKHADLTAGCSKIIVETTKGIAGELSLMRNLQANHETVAKLMAHSKIRGVTFTGSSSAGRKIGELAGKNLKKSVLELGGSDAYIVLADADLAKAAKICAAARLVNGGQSCVAGKRFLIERSIAEQFVSAMAKEMEKFKPGDPLKDDTLLGPMASKKFQQQIMQQVEDLKKKGGRVLCGGTALEGPGAFYPPTLIYFEKAVKGLGDIEVFGPVATVVAVDSAKQAMEIANDSSYGLGGAIFTVDEKRGRELLLDMVAGFVVVNDQVKSDVRLPFGGVKDSGYGRELSVHGVHEFCNIKTLAVGRPT
jgi:succinate-semialdehyde dehydrogenase/glutarate-semialdehyde dehydrogenase